MTEDDRLLYRLDAKTDTILSRLEKIDAKFDGFDTRLDEADRKIAVMKAQGGMIAGLVAAVFSAGVEFFRRS